jgi:hypothetical protein
MTGTRSAGSTFSSLLPGEAALALSRELALGTRATSKAATSALARLSGPGWSFFGSRYYFGEEHWTCQAADDLWDRAPDPRRSTSAFGGGLRAQASVRSGDTPYDADGAYGLGPLVTPRLTPVGSRAEAGIATLEAAMRARVPDAELSALRRQMRRSLAVLMRHQFHPGPAHLFADPAAVDGALPGSEVDWQIRIDYAQHTGSALVRWLSLMP